MRPETRDEIRDAVLLIAWIVAAFLAAGSIAP
jgi:hypothetical protein